MAWFPAEGGLQVAQGYVSDTLSGYQTVNIPLSFTPTRVIWWTYPANNSYVTAVLDTVNALDYFFGASNGSLFRGQATQNPYPLITIGDNSIDCMFCVGAQFNNKSAYWIAIKE